MKPLLIQFPFNNLLSYMEYKPIDKEFGELTLVFKKKKGLREARTYNVSRETGYRMVYCKTSADVLDNFNTYIKEKVTVINVKTLK